MNREEYEEYLSKIYRDFSIIYNSADEEKTILWQKGLAFEIIDNPNDSGFSNAFTASRFLEENLMVYKKWLKKVK